MPNPKFTVLLVEDSEDIRFLMKFILEAKGCRVVEAENGQQAVELAPQVKPDLILMDLSMPVLDGWEATRQLREIPGIQDTPIVGLSAHCEDRWREDALEAGCDECIQKPIEPEVLEEILTRVKTAAQSHHEP
jgi:two-component system cell cycle response regulator DivK